MTAVKTPNVDLPADAPNESRDWAVGNGESVVQEWPIGTPADILAKYEDLKATAEAGGGIEALAYRKAAGRGSLVARYARTGNTIPGYGNDVTVIEELYAIDVIKDVREAPYWSTEAATKLTDDQVAWVTLCVENRWSETEISSEASAVGQTVWGSWSDSMKELRYHMLHGVDSYYETAFVLRRSFYGVRTSQVQASFTDINTVVTAPTFESEMDQLIEALPDGEWLYRPPQAEHLGKGRWRVTQEWHWASAWSIIYGGTWQKP